jgi:opacity protein-like surface antigen
MRAAGIAVATLVVTLLSLLVTSVCDAQSRSPQIRGFADLGSTSFTASESFETILGASSGLVLGGGGEVVLPGNVFIAVRASRFHHTGHRVFLSDGERFDLGINTGVTVRPLEITGGYRFAPPRARVVPYGGGGIGWHRYEETSDFAIDTENVDETARGYHIVGGAEVRIRRWIGAAGEAQWTSVPDALGKNRTGVSSAFGETNLGGATIRAKVVIGY